MPLTHRQRSGVYPGTPVSVVHTMRGGPCDGIMETETGCVDGIPLHGTDVSAVRVYIDAGTHAIYVVDNRTLNRSGGLRIFAEWDYDTTRDAYTLRRGTN